MAASCLPEVMTGIELERGSVELRGVKEGYKWDMWELNELELKLIRHVRIWRHEMLDPRIRLANKSPVPIAGQWSRLTGERVTYKTYKDGSTATVRDGNFLTLSNARSTDPKQWRGRVEFGLKHKPQLRHVQKTAPRPYDPIIGRDKSEVVNEDIVEFHKSNDPSGTVDRLDNEPAILDQQIDFSFLATENDLPKRTILNATDEQTGYSMAVVLPAKGSIEKYAVAELRRFVFEVGRTFGIVQYDKESSLKSIAKDMCKTIGGLSMRAAPTGHSQSQGSAKCKNRQEDLNGSPECTLGRNTEADEVILGNENGVFKVRTVKWRPPSQQWNATGVSKMLSVPRQPKGDGVDSTAFVMPPDLGVRGRVKPPPGLSRVEEDEENEEDGQLEDMVPGQSESLTVQDLLDNDGSDRAPAEIVHVICKRLGTLRRCNWKEGPVCFIKTYFRRAKRGDLQVRCLEFLHEKDEQLMVGYWRGRAKQATTVREGEEGNEKVLSVLSRCGLELGLKGEEKREVLPKGGFAPPVFFGIFYCTWSVDVEDGDWMWSVIVINPLAFVIKPMNRSTWSSFIHDHSEVAPAQKLRAVMIASVTPMRADQEEAEFRQKAPKRQGRRSRAPEIPTCKWIASIVGVEEVVGKVGAKIEVDVNAEEGELDQEMRLAEPLLWESEFSPEAEKKGVIKEMNSMKEFDVYDEVMVKDCTEEQVSEALDCTWVKVWKTETDLVVVRGCFQNVEKTEEDKTTCLRRRLHR
ncbi:unnamed protein product [Symbiodinium microadriaticum]|nr:unnamed protein product [Symbiodinium microadriaticum]